MAVKTEIHPMQDAFSERYAEYIESTYDCVDRVVLNAYWQFGQSPGGFRTWWRQLTGSDENLNTNALIRYARKYARRVRAYAAANDIPLLDCTNEDRKHELAEKCMPEADDFVGVFAIMVSRFPAPVWEVQSGNNGNIHLHKKSKWVKQYWFHIMDPEWGHITIRLSPHPPFTASIMLNGHEYVARQASKVGITFDKEGNSFSNISDAAGLVEVADTLYSESAIGQLHQICERWIYSSCLCFALSSDDQQRTHFRYSYSVYQTELSRNLLFTRGSQMDTLFNTVIDRVRSHLDLKTIKTIFGARKRPTWRKGHKPFRIECLVERPTYDLTIFKLHFGTLTLKIYTKGEKTLRIEIIVHNMKRLNVRRSLPNFGDILRYLQPILYRFLDTLRGIAAPFIADDFLESLAQPTQLGAARMAALNLEQPRLRAVLQAILALAPTPNGFTASQLASKVQELMGDPLYSPRQAAYDLKKLRAKDLVLKIGNSRKYSLTHDGGPAISALLVLREQIIKPVLAGAGKPKSGPSPKNCSPLDQLYLDIQALIRNLLLEFGFAL